MEEEKRMRRAAEKIILRWMHLALAPAMAGWQEHCKQKKRLQRAAFKIVLRWQHMALSPAFAGEGQPHSATALEGQQPR